MKTILFIILCLSLASCQTWKKVLYGSDPCGNAWQMQKGKTTPSLMR
jgi:hypothetical protein